MNYLGWKGLLKSSGPIPDSKQSELKCLVKLLGLLPFQHPQEWRFCSLSGQAVIVFNCLLGEFQLLIFRRNDYCLEEAEDSNKFTNLLSLQLNKPNSQSLSSCILCFSTLSDLVAPYRVIPCLFALYWNGYKVDKMLGMWTHKYRQEGITFFFTQ